MTMAPEGAHLTLTESAAWLGAASWLSERLFTVAGGWVRECADPAVAVWLADASRHHAWHAEILAGLLPRIEGRPPESWLAADAAVEAAVTDWGVLSPSPEGAAVLVRVLMPRLAGSCRRLLALTSPVADGELRRTVGFVLVDLERDRGVGEDTLVGLVDEERIQGTVAAQSLVESHLVHSPLLGGRSPRVGGAPG